MYRRIVYSVWVCESVYIHNSLTVNRQREPYATHTRKRVCTWWVVVVVFFSFFISFEIFFSYIFYASPMIVVVIYSAVRGKKHHHSHCVAFVYVKRMCAAKLVSCVFVCFYYLTRALRYQWTLSYIHSVCSSRCRSSSRLLLLYCCFSLLIGLLAKK